MLSCSGETEGGDSAAPSPGVRRVMAEPPGHERTGCVGVWKGMCVLSCCWVELLASVTQARHYVARYKQT